MHHRYVKVEVMNYINSKGDVRSYIMSKMQWMWGTKSPARLETRIGRVLGPSCLLKIMKIIILMAWFRRRRWIYW
jgi:hypothetical protein